MVYDTEMIDIDGVTTLTAAKVADALISYGREISKVVCSVETNSVRVRCDGVDPDSNTGHLLAVGDILNLNGSDVRNFKAIKAGASAGKIAVSYEV